MKLLRLCFLTNGQHLKLLTMTRVDCLSSWFGVGSIVLYWLKSDLTDCSQCINIGSILSETKKHLYGVSEGSAINPILLSLYTTPPAELSKSS